MKIGKNIFKFNKGSFLFFKIFLWICVGIIFGGVSIVIPATSYNITKELIILFCLVVVVNLHISYLHPIFSKKNKFLYFVLLAASILFCAFLEILLVSKSLNYIYLFLDKKIIFFFIFAFILLRDIALFVIFFWVEHFNRLIHLYREKEKIHQEEMALLIEKQEFEKKFSRKKLFPHYFFNILEHITMESFANNKNSKLMDKVKFVLYYFLVDAEKEKIVLEKEIAFYQYYIELENFRHQKDISVKFNIVGQPEEFTIIPLLFEPLISNALKYTHHDGTGWVDITVDALQFPTLKFYCKNNYTLHSSNITSSENGLKIFEQRLELCYKNKHSLNITQSDDLYEVVLSVEVF